MKKFILCLCFLGLMFTFVDCKDNSESTKKEITINFEGAESIVLKENETVSLPSIKLDAGQSLLGWALKEDATKALVSNSVTYEQMANYESDGLVKLYPVIENKIEVVMKGLTDSTSYVSDLDKNLATLPLVSQTGRQKFLGWATTENASAPEIASDAVLNYETIKPLAKNAKITLYPVMINYDIMICVHSSHSNGNVYVSDAQKAELKAQIDKYFEGKNLNILIDFVDGVSSTGFAKEAIKKDYDIVLTSKTARDGKDGSSGDIRTAAVSAGLTYYAEADENETVVDAIILNQSRQVCRILGSDEAKPYQEEIYNFLITPIDYTVEITFRNGTKIDTITAHRVGPDGEISNVAYLPSDASGVTDGGSSKVFDGWTTIENGTEIEFANASFNNVYEKAVNGKITLYPIFTNYVDAYIVVWGVNGSNEYVSKEQFDTMVSLYKAYIKENAISEEGKNIEIVYFEGKTDAFKEELTKSYVSAAVGASALSNSDYGQYWAIAEDLFASVLNVKCTNASRYCAISENAKENVFALAFFKALCEKEITVKFSDGTTTSEGVKLNSVTKNEAKLPETFVAPAGKALVGYATTKDATEPTVTGAVTYANVASLATNGEVTLFPVYGSYDLVVYVWCGQSLGGTTYVTEEEVEALKAAFISSLGEKATNKKIQFNSVWGKTAEYAALIGAEADVILSGKNINDEAQCAKLLDATYGKLQAINVTFASGSSRYAGLCKKAVDNALAKELIIYLCESELTVTFNGEASQTIKKVYNTTELVVPTITPVAGKVFKGWATSENATVAEFTNDDLTFDKLVEKATDKAIKLYSVVVEETAQPTYDLTVAILCGTATKTHITTAEIDGIKEAFIKVMESKGVSNINVEYIINPGTTGAKFIATFTKDVDVVIGASNLTSQEGFPGMYNDCTWTLITNRTLIANESRYIGVISTCNKDQLTTAKAFVEMLTK